MWISEPKILINAWKQFSRSQTKWKRPRSGSGRKSPLNIANYYLSQSQFSDQISHPIQSNLTTDRKIKIQRKRIFLGSVSCMLRRIVFTANETPFLLTIWRHFCTNDSVKRRYRHFACIMHDSNRIFGSPFCYFYTQRFQNVISSRRSLLHELISFSEDWFMLLSSYYGGINTQTTATIIYNDWRQLHYHAASCYKQTFEFVDFFL